MSDSKKVAKVEAKDEKVNVEQLKKKAPKVTMKDLQEEIQALRTRLETLEAKRGPKSTREMTEDDARKILPGGELAGKSHKEVAAELGLSYGQVYSCRGGYTFKKLHEELQKKKAVNG
jgi:transposase